MENQIIIVGNSSKLNDQAKGKDIDTFGRVVRINQLFLDQEHTGLKITDWWRCARPWTDCQSQRILSALDLMFLLDYRHGHTPEIAKFPNHKKVFVDQSYFDRAHENIIWTINDGRPKWARTGLVAICYYLQIYKTVWITGMDITAERTDYYYNRPSTVDNAWMHDHDAEIKKIQWLIKHNKVKVL